MCGIAGAYSVKIKDNYIETLVKKIVNNQICRGPDYQSVEVIDGNQTNVVLGHNRLSIIDLSPEANQPMWDHEERYCLVFNGEIYNYLELKQELISLGHKFITRSDSEVILEGFKEWGIKGVERFNGMFAFALLDKVSEKLYLVRDRFGVKPLYYYHKEDLLIFASTPEVIASELGLEPNLKYLAFGLQFMIYDVEDLSPFEGVKALKPSHFMEINLSDVDRVKTNLTQYYNLSERVQGLTDDLKGMDYQNLRNTVAELFNNSIDFRLRADVPLGVSLSGGLDSSTSAALAVERGGKIIGFTFGHPDDYDSEGPLVKKLSESIGIEVNYIRPKIDDIIKGYYQTIEAQGAPFLSGSVVAQYLVFQAVNSAGVKVLLGGQGGDEIFMGYRKYMLYKFKKLMAQGYYPQAFIFLMSLSSMFLAEIHQIPLYWKHRHRFTRSTGMDNHYLKLPEVKNINYDINPQSPLWERQLIDVNYSSLPTLLRYEDRNSMGNSVESRLMFLDYRLVETALALPEAVKIKKGYGKWIVRDIMGGKLPDEIRCAKYKSGFDVPQNLWIDQGLGTSIRKNLKYYSKIIKDFLGPFKSIDEVYSDTQLKYRQSAFAEATTLIWLGKYLSKSKNLNIDVK